MSIGIQVNTQSLAQVQARLNSLAKIDTQTLLEGIGAELESQTKRRLSEEKTTPEGKDWQGYVSPHYEKYKREVLKSSGGLLELHGDLIESIEYQLKGNRILLGSPLVYSRRQNKLRQYLGLSSENKEDIAAMVDDFWQAKMREGFY